MFRRACLVLLLIVPPAAAQKEYGFDNRKSSGQPYLAPEESVRRMKVAEGFEVKLFAAEPQVVNPVAMTVDERGRVWVIECFEYPKRTPPGRMPRDRIVILEDTKGTGVCDKRTVFCEGKDFPERFDLATGLEVGHGGVFVGAPPYLWFIENKNDKPGKFEKLLGGFGSQDTHETLNTFQWGPDGWLYGLHGIYTQSKVKPGEPGALATGGYGVAPEKKNEKTPPGAVAPTSPVEINAGMWRYHPVTRKFEIVAEGTSNPWGWDYRNTDGQMIVCCCVIPHLFHFVPGGIYKRQSGQSSNPYAYGAINEICDHTFHKESGWAHAGLLSLDTPLMPPELRDSVIFGSIHGCSIKRNVLKRNGSTFTASRADDFLVSGDKNFRPINLRWGHNGEIYVIDWHDQNPCSQADPDSWDYEHGRVYRIQKKGAATKKAEDLGKFNNLELAKTVAREVNPWQNRTAYRLLMERMPTVNDPAFSDFFGQLLDGIIEKTALEKESIVERDKWQVQLFSRPHASGEEYRSGMLTLQALPPHILAELTFGSFDPKGPFVEIAGLSIIRMLGDRIAHFGNVEIRPAYQERVTPFRKYRDFAEKPEGFTTIAKVNRSPSVRLELASAVIRVGRDCDTILLIHELLKHKEDAADPVIPLMLWLAYEPKLAAKPQAELTWLKTNAAGNPLITDHIVPRAMRRLVATGKAADLAACVEFVGLIGDAVRLRALEGLAEALKGRQVDMPAGWTELKAKLAADPDERIRKLAAMLAISFRDLEAARRALAVAADPKQPAAIRAEAIRALAPTQLPEAKPVLLTLIVEPGEIGVESLRALAGYDGTEIPSTILSAWKSLPPSHRPEVISLLASRKEWARQLLAAVALGTVDKTALNANTVLRLRAFKDANLNADIERVWGKVRDTPAELNALIDKMRGELAAGPASFSRGKLVFENQCAKCHKFEGRGHSVGPELDGAGRDIEYLLINILDPNRVVGQPYFIRRLTLRNGRIEEGLLAAEDPQTITLKGESDARRVFDRKDVAEIEVIERSMMPEGLDKAMTVQDFRDLVRYVMADPFVTEWQTIGPSKNHWGRVIISGYPTPVAIDHSLGVNGRLELQSKGEGMYTSAQALVTAPTRMKVRLLIGADQTVQVVVPEAMKGGGFTLAGKEIYRGKPGDGPARPDQVSVELDLEKGVNSITIGIQHKGEKATIYARFHDPERKLTYPEPPNKK
jgi:putative membrane-bound dehydrogenase-like protein